MNHPLLTKLQPFAALSEEEQRVLTEAAVRTRDLEADEDIAHEDDEPTACSLVLDGVVCRYKLLPEGKRQIIGFQIAGDLCDLCGFVLGRMDHSVGTLTRARIAVIAHDRLQEITEKYPRIARALWQESLIDAAISREWVANLGRRSAYQRVAHLLCEMGLRLKAAGRAQDSSFDWPITQAEVADAMGLSTIHVNRVLRQLRGQGLIVLRGAMVTIKDWDGLKEAGQFDASYLYLGRRSSIAAGPWQTCVPTDSTTKRGSGSDLPLPTGSSRLG